MRPLFLIPLLLGAACGPSSSEDTGEPVTTAATTGEDPTATSSPATTTPATTTPATSATDPDPTTGAPDPGTTAPTTGPMTTDPVETTGDITTGETTGASTTGDTTDSSTGTGEDVQYVAFFWAGGLDHLSIYEADFANDRCTGLHLARPYGPQPAFPISMPPEWGVQHIERGPGTAGCLEGMPLGLDEFGSAGVGSVTWDPDPNLFCPLELDLDVTLEFGTPEPMQAMAVVVQGCQ